MKTETGAKAMKFQSSGIAPHRADQLNLYQYPPLHILPKHPKAAWTTSLDIHTINQSPYIVEDVDVAVCVDEHADDLRLALRRDVDAGVTVLQPTEETNKNNFILEWTTSLDTSSRTLFVREDVRPDVHVTSNAELRNNVRLLLNVELRKYVISRQIVI